MEIFVKRFTDTALIPTRAHPTDAGLDLFTDESVTLNPRARHWVRTGIAVEIPAGYVGLIWPRSSLSAQYIDTSAGVIDSGYHGEVKVLLVNNSNDIVRLKHCTKIAQLLIQPVSIEKLIVVDELSETERGDHGFGSSGC
jgi:dUTP pyrophosphatase